MKTIHHPKMKKQFKGFTLVELIVVITILVILGTIAFINLGGFAGSARDSARVSDMKSIETGLALYNVKSGSYPDPETPVSIEASGTQIGLQGYLGDVIGSLIKMSPTPLDPLDKSKYVYSVNTARTKYQVMGFLEANGSTAMEENILIDTAYAADLSTRFPKVGGDNLGILLDSGTLAPVSGAKIDLITTNSGSVYNVYFGNTTSDIITTTGTGIFSGIYNRQPELIKNKALASMDPNLVGYWDMETLTGTMLKDLSGKGNNGTCYNSGTVVACGGASGGPQIVDGNGKSGKAMSLNGISDWIKLDPNLIDFTTTSYKTIIVLFKKEPTDGLTISFADRNVNFKDSGGFRFQGSYQQLYYFPQGTTNQTITYDNPDFLSSKYNSMAFVYKNNDNSSLYSNGVKVKNGVYGTDIIETKVFNIGRQNNKGLVYSKGLIDEVRIYNRALSDSEIQALYSATK